jgi:hypothetical protein
VWERVFLLCGSWFGILGQRKSLHQESSAIPTLITAAFKAVSEVYRPGYGYKKAGVMLTDLSSAGLQQQSLFFRLEEEQVSPIMEAVDRINDKWGPRYSALWVYRSAEGMEFQAVDEVTGLYNELGGIAGC